MTNRKKVATAEELAAMAFGPDLCADVPQQERVRRSRNMIAALVPHLIIAVELAACSKEEMVEIARKEIDPTIALFDHMVEAIEQTKAVMEIFETARARLLISMATVEQELAA